MCTECKLINEMLSSEYDILVQTLNQEDFPEWKDVSTSLWRDRLGHELLAAYFSDYLAFHELPKLDKRTRRNALDSLKTKWKSGKFFVCCDELCYLPGVDKPSQRATSIEKKQKAEECVNTNVPVREGLLRRVVKITGTFSKKSTLFSLALALIFDPC